MGYRSQENIYTVEYIIKLMKKSQFGLEEEQNKLQIEETA